MPFPAISQVALLIFPFTVVVSVARFRLVQLRGASTYLKPAVHLGSERWTDRLPCVTTVQLLLPELNSPWDQLTPHRDTCNVAHLQHQRKPSPYQLVLHQTQEFPPPGL